MRYVEVDGLRLSVIGLGTWQFGSPEWRYGETYSRETAPSIVRRAIDLGVTLIDTAEMYTFGRSERIVGDAIASGHEGVVVATKFMPILPFPGIVEWQARGSLRRLGMDSIDLYQVHWPNPLASPRSTVTPLRRLLDAGIVQRVGVSNHSLARWRASERALRRPILTNQVRFSLTSPLPHWELVPYVRDEGRLLIAYSPLGQGLLGGGYGAERPGPTDVRRFSPFFRPAGLRRVEPLIAAVRDVAAAHGATPAQVALAWLTGHGNVVAIPGARTIAQLEENAAAGDLVLTLEEQVSLTWLADRVERSAPR